MAHKIDYGSSALLADMHGIRACLDQIHDEVAGYGMTIAATLIAAASEAIADEVSKNTATTLHRSLRHLQ